MPGAGIVVVDLGNKTISSLGEENTTSPFGGLDGIESDANETRYYVTDNPAGKIFTVNANGTGYTNLVDLRTSGTADLGFIPNQNVIMISAELRPIKASRDFSRASATGCPKLIRYLSWG